jgi:hypothetical protein
MGLAVWAHFRSLSETDKSAHCSVGPDLDGITLPPNPGRWCFVREDATNRNIKFTTLNFAIEVDVDHLITVMRACKQ